MASLLRRHHEHEPPVGEIPVPHGPVTGDEHQHYPRGHYATDQEKEIFRYLTQPDDSYTSEGIYWADLPLSKRFSFVSKTDRAESKAEAESIWLMFKKDPLSPVAWYFRHAVLPGAGLGLEGYVLFSIGNLEPLFRAAWPTCWGHEATECASNWISSVTYLEVIGIMVGQVGVGVSNLTTHGVMGTCCMPFTYFLSTIDTNDMMIDHR